MPSEFHRFKELPLELRVQIWREASNVSRNIKVLIGNSQDTFPGVKLITNTSGHGYMFVSCVENRPPAILQVNQESRCQGLRVYKTIARDSSTGQGSSDTPAPYLYISPNDFVTPGLFTSLYGSAYFAIEKFLEMSGVPSTRVKEMRVYSIFTKERRIVKVMTNALLAFPLLETIIVEHSSNIFGRVIAKRVSANVGWAGLILQLVEVTASGVPNIRPKFGFKWIKEKVRKLEQDNSMPPNITKLRFPALNGPAAQLNLDARELDGSGT